LLQVGHTLGSAMSDGGGVGDSTLLTDAATKVAALLITSEVARNSPSDSVLGGTGPDPISSSVSRPAPGR